MSEPLSTTITWRGSTADPAYGRVSELTKPGGKAIRGRCRDILILCNAFRGICKASRSRLTRRTAPA